MTSAPALQAGFGEMLGEETLLSIKSEGYTIVRIAADVPNTNVSHDDATVARLAQEVLDVGLQPLVTIRRPELVRLLSGTGALVEFGNEPDLKGTFGWPTFYSYWTPCREAIRLALEHDVRLYIGAVSNLNNRGFDFLRKIPWHQVDPRICCSVHRYPEKGKGPTAPHNSFKSREHEVQVLRSIAGSRPYAITEVGYHRGNEYGYTEQECTDYYSWERNFASAQGFEICTAYQINDGPPEDTSAVNNYGLRRRDGTWRPASRAFTGRVDAPAAPALPPAPAGEVVSFRIGGFYLCAEGGGGRELVANRTAEGPWEQFHVNRLDDGTYSVQAHSGHYVCAELHGAVNATRTELGPWERWTIDELGGYVFFKSHHGLYLCAEGGGGGEVVANRTAVGPWEMFQPSNFAWAIKTCKRPLVGQVAVKNKTWHDSTGLRRIIGNSLFNLLRVKKYDRAAYLRHLDETAEYEYQTSRVFLYVGGWVGFWDDAEVLPVPVRKWIYGGQTITRPADANGVLQYGPTLPAWSDWDLHFEEMLHDYLVRGLKLHITAGDGQIFFPGMDQASWDAEIEMHRRAARIVARVDPTLVAFWEARNEIPMNSHEGGSERDVQRCAEIIKAVSEILPDVVTGPGAMLSEEPDKLSLGMRYGGEACFVHPTREPFETCLKRTLGLVYWEGDWRAFPHPYVHGEPKGMNAGPLDGKGDDAYQPSLDVAEMYALHAMAALVGMADNVFTGASVKLTDYNSQALGYKEIPRLLSETMPEDVTTWVRETAGGGAILYWTNGKEFRSAMYKDWDPTPPRPVAEWKIYAGHSTFSGVGTPLRATGYLVGRFQ